MAIQFIMQLMEFLKLPEKLSIFRGKFLVDLCNFLVPKAFQRIFFAFYLDVGDLLKCTFYTWLCLNLHRCCHLEACPENGASSQLAHCFSCQKLTQTLSSAHLCDWHSSSSGPRGHFSEHLRLPMLSQWDRLWL